MRRQQDNDQTTHKRALTLLLPASCHPRTSRHYKRFQRIKHQHLDSAFHRDTHLQAGQIAAFAQRAGPVAHPRQAAFGLQEARVNEKTRRGPQRQLPVPLDVPPTRPLLQDQVPPRILLSAMR